MINFCPSCGGIVTMASDIHVPNAHERLCKCPPPETLPMTVRILSDGEPTTSVTWHVNSLSEEQVREIVRDEVAKALAEVKQEVMSEAPQEMARQVRAKTGRRSQ